MFNNLIESVKSLCKILGIFLILKCFVFGLKRVNLIFMHKIINKNVHQTFFKKIYS